MYIFAGCILLIINSAITIQVEEGGLEVVERLASEWRVLCEEDVIGDPRYRPEWITSYLLAFVPAAEILVVTARIDGRLKAVLPLLRERSSFNGLPLKKLTTHIPMTVTRIGLIQSAGPEGGAASAAVWKRLKDVPGWQMIELREAHAESPVSQLIRCAQADRYPTASVPMFCNPYLPIPPYDPAKPFSVEPRNHRKRSKLRKVLRDLGKPAEHLRLKRFDQWDRDALQRFYKLEASGWKGREGSAILSVPPMLKFHDQITEAASRFGYLTLYELYLDGHHVAGHLGFTYRGRYFMPKVAYDENYGQYDVGHLIVYFILQDCAQRGLRAFEFLGGSDPWKMAWTSHVREQKSFLIFRRSPLGYLLCATQSRIKPALKDLLTRVGGRRQQQNSETSNQHEMSG